jgi:hypothetical protein
MERGLSVYLSMYLCICVSVYRLYTVDCQMKMDKRYESFSHKILTIADKKSIHTCVVNSSRKTQLVGKSALPGMSLTLLFNLLLQSELKLTSYISAYFLFNLLYRIKFKQLILQLLYNRMRKSYSSCSVGFCCPPTLQHVRGRLSPPDTYDRHHFFPFK